MSDKFYFFKGRVALYAILRAIDIGQEDEVILPGFTCVVVPNAITYLGAKPIYVDIDPDTFNIDVSKLEEKLSTKHSSLVTRPKAIIVQHTFGIPAEMDKIINLAKKNNLYVIEDSCHAIGSRYKGKEVGTFGDAAFYSSQWSKPVTTGLGGWAVLNNPKLRENMQKIYSVFIRPSFRDKLLLRFQYLTYSKLFKPSTFWFVQNSYRTFSKLGITIGSSSNEELACARPTNYEKKMAPWQIYLLEKKLRLINKVIEHRKKITVLYEDLLKRSGIKIIQLSADLEPVFLRYPVLVGDKGEVLRKAKKRSIEIGDWFISPVHPNLNGWEKVGYQKGSCPIAEDICQHIINLPTHPGISEGMAERIVNLFIEAIQE